MLQTSEGHQALVGCQLLRVNVQTCMAVVLHMCCCDHQMLFELAHALPHSTVSPCCCPCACCLLRMAGADAPAGFAADG
jgi:hypothetical protein